MKFVGTQNLLLISAILANYIYVKTAEPKNNEKYIEEQTAKMQEHQNDIDTLQEQITDPNEATKSFNE